MLECSKNSKYSLLLDQNQRLTWSCSGDASASVITFSGQTWFRHQLYVKALELFYKCALGNRVDNKPTL